MARAPERLGDPVGSPVLLGFSYLAIFSLFVVVQLAAHQLHVGPV